VERQPAIDRQPVLVLPLEAQWLALLPLVAQPPVRPDLGSNPP